MTELEKQVATEVENETIAENKKGLMEWIKAHKKQLILAGVSIPTLIMIVLGLKNKDAIQEFWSELSDELKNGAPYSSKWFEKASDDVLSAEREKVRIDYCSSGRDFTKASRLQNLLWRFDEEMRKRAWGDEIPHAPRIHREHGWYLPNDD